mmetsp:Transcript_33322/g.93467  ORF Transcript_33322/g.93467 Transcript_33322/m.93467 type:complete len:733 (+) Transcript_33322:173-2371(+)
MAAVVRKALRDGVGWATLILLWLLIGGRKLMGVPGIQIPLRCNSFRADAQQAEWKAHWTRKRFVSSRMERELKSGDRHPAEVFGSVIVLEGSSQRARTLLRSVGMANVPHVVVKPVTREEQRANEWEDVLWAVQGLSEDDHLDLLTLTRALRAFLDDPRSASALILRGDLELVEDAQVSRERLTQSLLALPEGWNFLALGREDARCHREVHVGADLYSVAYQRGLYAFAVSRTGARAMMCGKRDPKSRCLLKGDVGDAMGYDPTLISRDRCLAGHTAANSLVLAPTFAVSPALFRPVVGRPGRPAIPAVGECRGGTHYSHYNPTLGGVTSRVSAAVNVALYAAQQGLERGLCDLSLGASAGRLGSPGIVALFGCALTRPPGARNRTEDVTLLRYKNQFCPEGSYVLGGRLSVETRLREFLEKRLPQAGYLSDPYHSSVEPNVARAVEYEAWPRPPVCGQAVGFKKKKDFFRGTLEHLKPRSHGLKLDIVPIPKVGTTILKADEVMNCMGSFDLVDMFSPTPRQYTQVALVREPIRRWISGIQEVVRRVTTGICPGGACDKATLPTLEELSKILWWPRVLLSEQKSNTTALVEALVIDTLCGIPYHASEHVQTQSVFLQSSKAPTAALLHMEDMPERQEAAHTVASGKLLDKLRKLSECMTSDKVNQLYHKDLRMDLRDKANSGLFDSKFMWQFLLDHPDFMRVLCAYYVQDYACLGYELPAPCQGGAFEALR